MKIKPIIIALLLMFIFSWCSFRGYDTNFFQTTKPIIKHSINFSLLLAIAFTGYFGLIAVSKIWIKKIWVLIYSLLIILLACIGVVDLFFRINNYNVRDMIANVRMFFTSPLPFAILLFIGYSSRKTPDEAFKREKQ